MKVMSSKEAGSRLGHWYLVTRCMHSKNKKGLGYGRPVMFCGRVLEVSDQDIKRHVWSKSKDLYGTDYGVICPECGHFVHIPKEFIPENALNSAQEIHLEGLPV